MLTLTTTQMNLWLLLTEYFLLLQHYLHTYFVHFPAYTFHIKVICMSLISRVFYCKMLRRDSSFNWDYNGDYLRSLIGSWWRRRKRSWKWLLTWWFAKNLRLNKTATIERVIKEAVTDVNLNIVANSHLSVHSCGLPKILPAGAATPQSVLSLLTCRHGAIETRLDN